MYWAYPSGLNIFRCFTSNSVVIENAVGYSFYANHSIDGAMYACWLDNANYCLFVFQFSNGDFWVQILP